MAYTKVTDNTSFSKNKIITDISGGSFEENKHSYFIDIVRDYSIGSFTYNGSIPSISVDDADIYFKNEVVFLEITSSVLVGYAYLSGYYKITSVNYVANEITIEDNGNFSNAVTGSATCNYLIGKADRIKKTADKTGSAYFEINEVVKHYLSTRFDYNNITTHKVEGFDKKFKLVYGESFVKRWNITDAVTPPNNTLNKFVNEVIPAVFETTIARMVNIQPNDYVIVEGLSDSFYNGIQEVQSVDQVYLTTKKPQKNGVLTGQSGYYFKADNSVLNTFVTSEEKTFINSGFLIENLIGLTQSEVETKESRFVSQINNKAFLAYAPREQQTTIDDEGYLYYYYNTNEGGTLTINYAVTDVNGILTNNPINLSPSESGVYAIPSNPKTINKNGLGWIDCDTKSYRITANLSEHFEYTLIKKKSFNSARLIWGCPLGSYQGLTFTCKNVVKVTSENNSYRAEKYNYSDNVRLNDLTRGEEVVDVRTMKIYELQTDYVTEEVGVFLETLMKSSDVLMQYNGGDLRSVNLMTDEIEINESSDGLIQYKIKVKSAIYED